MCSAPRGFSNCVPPTVTVPVMGFCHSTTTTPPGERLTTSPSAAAQNSGSRTARQAMPATCRVRAVLGLRGGTRCPASHSSSAPASSASAPARGGTTRPLCRVNSDQARAPPKQSTPAAAMARSRHRICFITRLLPQRTSKAAGKRPLACRKKAQSLRPSSLMSSLSAKATAPNPAASSAPNCLPSLRACGSTVTSYSPRRRSALASTSAKSASGR